jgi:Ca2+-binding RTX toxin-like protein
VILNSQPTANVTIKLNTATQLTSNISQVVFTPQNWNIAQNVTVIAINDTIAEGNHTGIIQFTSTSSDATYNNFAIAPLTVNISDIKELTPDNDTFYATSGNDIIDALPGNDRIFGQDGDDTIYGGAGADILYGGAGIDTLYGDEDSDRLYGDTGNDKIYGGAGADILYGGAGNDYLDGGTESDRYYGEAGADTFVIGSGQGLDSIYDYEKGIDKIFVLGSIPTFEEKSGSSVLIKSGTETLATIINAVVGQISYVSSVP